jgi:hypothetical protein
MSNREPQILLKADERSIVLELSRDGKFAAKSSGWGENLVCLEGRQARCCGQERALVLTRIPARPRSHLAMPIRSLPQHRLRARNPTSARAPETERIVAPSAKRK